MSEHDSSGDKAVLRAIVKQLRGLSQTDEQFDPTNPSKRPCEIGSVLREAIDKGALPNNQWRELRGLVKIVEGDASTYWHVADWIHKHRYDLGPLVDDRVSLSLGVSLSPCGLNGPIGLIPFSNAIAETFARLIESETKAPIWKQRYDFERQWQKKTGLDPKTKKHASKMRAAYVLEYSDDDEVKAKDFRNARARAKNSKVNTQGA